MEFREPHILTELPDFHRRCISQLQFYLPFQLTKLVTGSESEVNGINWAIEIGMKYLSEVDEDDVEESAAVETAALKKWEELVTNDKLSKNRIESLEKFRERYGDQETDAIVKFPWFYHCNPGRYPGFRREMDQRLL